MDFTLPMSNRQRAQQDFAGLGDNLLRSLAMLKQAKDDKFNDQVKQAQLASLNRQGQMGDIELRNAQGVEKAQNDFNDFTTRQSLPGSFGPTLPGEMDYPGAPLSPQAAGDRFKYGLIAKIKTLKGQPTTPEDVQGEYETAAQKRQQEPQLFGAQLKNTQADTTLKQAEAAQKGNDDLWMPVPTTSGVYKLNKKTGEIAAALDENGNPLKGSGKGAMPPKEQFDAAGFGRRMEQANQIFSLLSAAGYNRADNTSAFQAVMPNFLRGKEAQMQDQAERNYVNAVLRRESGAAISKEEFANAEKQYFPRAGDSKDVLTQKAANRAQAMENMHSAAGPAWEMTPAVPVGIESPQAKPGAAPAASGTDKRSLALQALNDPEATAEEKAQATRILQQSLSLTGAQ